MTLKTNKPRYAALLDTSSYRAVMASAIDAFMSTCTPLMKREMVGCDVPALKAI